MEDAQICPADCPQRFRMCLTGEARDWYNDIVVPAQWDDLMEMFCQRFCIFGQTEEQWHDAWQKLTFNKVNGNINQFLSWARWLTRLLHLRDQSILIKLKQIIHERADTWLVVHDLNAMCGYLKKLYSPYQLKVAKEKNNAPPTPTPGEPTPFFVMQAEEDKYHLKVGTTSPTHVHFSHEDSLGEAVEKLATALDNLSFDQEWWGRGRSPPPRRPSKPYKPYITKGREDSSRDCSWRRDFRHNHRGQFFSRDQRGRDRDRDDSRWRFRKFDKSPSVKKPHSSSKLVNKDKDRCFRCHQHGHFARECPQAGKDNKKETKELIQEVLREMRQPPEDPQWKENYGPNTFQHSEPTLNM